MPTNRTIIRLRADLDFAAAPALRERLIDVLHRGTDLLVLDLSQVQLCDAAGLAVLVGTQRRAGLLGIPMRLVAPSLPVSKVLGSTGLKHYFTISPSEDGAAWSYLEGGDAPAVQHYQPGAVPAAQ